MKRTKGYSELAAIWLHMLDVATSSEGLPTHTPSSLAVTIDSDKSCVCYDPRRACAVRVTLLGLCLCVCVCVCMCVSVTQHLTSFVPQSILTFLAADEGRNF